MVEAEHRWKKEEEGRKREREAGRKVGRIDK